MKLGTSNSCSHERASSQIMHAINPSKSGLGYFSFLMLDECSWTHTHRLDAFVFQPTVFHSSLRKPRKSAMCLRSVSACPFPDSLVLKLTSSMLGGNFNGTEKTM